MDPVRIAFGKPRYGFNFQWMYIFEPGRQPDPPNERALDFMARHGFDFVRIANDYRFWTRDFDYLHPNESILSHFDRYLEATRSRGLHLSLNFHRAPGYCINWPEIERDNLWTDIIAQDGFVFQWETMARRFKGVSSEWLSFDLINEPPNVGQYGLTREGHAALIRRTVAAIRAVDPERAIVIDGLGGGHLPMPELADLGVVHSGRGYQPMSVSHYKANWWKPGPTLPPPTYPNCEWDEKLWNRDALRDFYGPWREVQAKGVTVHIGEFGCYNQTPNDVALRWFGDLFALYREFGWGYGMWNFDGAFGIVDHGRPGARWEEADGFRVDRDLLELMKESRV
jgi:endoglucanase